MSARQTFIPRSASRASSHTDTEHSSIDMQSSIVRPQHDAALSTPHKNDSEKKPRFAGMFAKNKHAAKFATSDHQAITDISFSNASGRYSGIRRPDTQTLAPRRSSSPFCGKGSSFVLSSTPGQNFTRPTSPIPNSALQRADLTISGLTDAHISTGGVVSGLTSASRVITAPVASYESIRPGELDSASNKSSTPKLQPTTHRERIREDLEPEAINEHEALLVARRTGIVAPMSRGVKRTIQDAQDSDGNFSLPDEVEYARRVKRGRFDEFAHELPSVRPDDSNHPGVDRSRLQPDLDADTVRQSSPPINQPGSGVVDDLSLEGMFANMEGFLSVETYTGLIHKWTTCSMEEWLQGSEELVKQFQDIIDFVKDHLTDSLALYSRLDNQVRDRREEQAQLSEQFKRGLGSARTDLIAICRGK